tara:strand:+ start:1561 stop:1698 length:138 start_codon:yes stop_codon:yes gene_type:complete
LAGNKTECDELIDKDTIEKARLLKCSDDTEAYNKCVTNEGKKTSA